MKFNDLKKGDDFKLSKDRKLIFKKLNNTEAHCNGERFGVILNGNHEVTQVKGSKIKKS